MSLITFEGWENYSTFAAVQSSLNCANINFGTISLISATDANSVTPRNSGACLKMTSSGGAYPRIAITHPSNASHTSGVFGFAWYNFLPEGRTIATHYATFVPIASLLDNSGYVHFFIGINSSGQIQVRRFSPIWNDTSNGSYEYNCGDGGCDVGYTILNEANYTLLASSSSLVIENAWNYIEVKYTISTTGSGGSIQIKLNRNSNDNTIDLTTNAQNTNTNNTNVRSICLGIFRGGQSSNAGGTNSQVYSLYYDDIYWCDQTGDTYNNFLGRVSCTKFIYNTVDNYTFADPVNSGTALSNVNEAFAGIGSKTTKNTANAIGQTLNLRATTVANETLSPILVRQYVYGYKSNASSDIALGVTDGANTIANSAANLNNDSVNGALRYRDYDNHPSGVEWTNASIASTTFRHEGIAI